MGPKGTVGPPGFIFPDEEGYEEWKKLNNGKDKAEEEEKEKENGGTIKRSGDSREEL